MTRSEPALKVALSAYLADAHPTTVRPSSRARSARAWRAVATARLAPGVTPTLRHGGGRRWTWCSRPRLRPGTSTLASGGRRRGGRSPPTGGGGGGRHGGQVAIAGDRACSTRRWRCCRRAGSLTFSAAGFFARLLGRRLLGGRAATTFLAGRLLCRRRPWPNLLGGGALAGLLGGRGYLAEPSWPRAFFDRRLLRRGGWLPPSWRSLLLAAASWRPASWRGGLRRQASPPPWQVAHCRLFAAGLASGAAVWLGSAAGGGGFGGWGAARAAGARRRNGGAGVGAGPDVARRRFGAKPSGQ